MGIPYWNAYVANTQMHGKGTFVDSRLSDKDKFPKVANSGFDNKRDEGVFNGAAQCATCHVPPLFSEPGWAMHTAAEIGIDDFQSQRAPDNRYRTTPLRGLFARSKGGFYHDGRFPDLPSVVEHYERVLKLSLNEHQRSDLVEYLKSL